MGQHFACHLCDSSIIGCIPSITLDIASIASFIPNSEDNAAEFSGLSPSHNSLPSSFADVSRTRQRATEAQVEDARNRRIVWDADAPARPKYAEDGDEVDVDTESDSAQEVPLGVRGPDGVIQSLPGTISVKKSMRNEDREFNYSSQTSDRVVCCFRNFIECVHSLIPLCHC